MTCLNIPGGGAGYHNSEEHFSDIHLHLSIGSALFRLFTTIPYLIFKKKEKKKNLSSANRNKVVSKKL
jgi:hypothetical protein